MAVVSCNEIHRGREAEAEYGQGRRFVRYWRVRTNDDTDGPYIVGSHPAIPLLGMPYYVKPGEADARAFVTSIRPQQDDADPRLWVVTVSYDSVATAAGGGSGEPGGGGASPQNRPENPLDRPVEWQMSWVEEQRAFTKDLDGRPYRNAAKHYFEPPRTRPHTLARITATKNYASFGYTQAKSYFNKVNSAAWKGFAKHEVKVEHVSLRSAFENGMGYVQATWSFLIDPDLWIPTRILNRGPFYLSAGGLLPAGTPIPFMDSMGNPTLGLLDEAGGKLAENVDPNYLQFRDYNEINLAGIF
jgi:hypothetical protein